MRDHGATVVAQPEPNLADLRAELGIPAEAATCHVAFIGGYAIDGHVPAEAIERLLADQPDAVGLAVPGMPPDSPGMGGDESTWAALDVVLIGNNGELTPFQY